MVQRGFRYAATAGALAGILTAAAGIAAAKQTVTLATYGADVNQWKDIEKAFEARYPDLDLRVDVYPFADYITKITTLVAGGTPPDVFQTWAQYKPKWVEEGMLLDLTDYWAKSKELQGRKFFPFMLEAAKYKGKFYGVPYDYNAEVWFLNMDHFQERGVAPPKENWTVQDFRAIAQKLTDPQNKIFGAANAVNWGWGDNLQWSWNWAGHEWVSADRRKVLVDAPKNIEMLEFWYKLGYEDKVVPTPGNQPVRGSFDGGYGMWQGWLSYVFRDTWQYNWGLATMPKAPADQKSFAQGHMWSIPANAKNPDVSWKLVEWLASAEGDRAMVRYDKRQPLTPDPELWDIFFAQMPEDRRRVAQGFVLNTLYGKGYARNMTYWVTWPELNEIMVRKLGEIFTQQKPIANTMRAAAQEMQAILDTNPGR